MDARSRRPTHGSPRPHLEERSRRRSVVDVPDGAIIFPNDVWPLRTGEPHSRVYLQALVGRRALGRDPRGRQSLLSVRWRVAVPYLFSPQSQSV